MEICKVTVATLNHEQMVDLLKTSAVVTVTVLPPVDPNTPRQGCTLQSCSYIVGSIDGEYDNVGVGEGVETGNAIRSSGAVQQQSVSAHSRRLRYERSVSPPRSSSSSGYGTGSSSRSFTVQGAAALAASAAAAAGAATISAIVSSNPEGTLKSTSSGHSSDDPWYDFMPDALETDLLTGPGASTTSPPPLPSRQGPPPSRLRSGHSCENFTPPVISVHQPSSANESMKTSRSQDQIFQQDGSSPSKNRATAPSSAYSTPPCKPKPVLESPSLVGRMGNYEDIRRLQTSAAGPQETAGSKVRPLNPPDYHHAMQSRLVALKSPDQQHGPNNRKSPSSTYASRSEDELSAGSANSLSPRSRRRHSKNNGAGTLTPSSGSSRNQSPRLFVEAKLKTNANGSVCSGGSGSGGGMNGQKRCSTNLQEELLRLISPDAVDEASADDSSVIVTHARPANAVLSSANSSVQSADMADLPDSEEMDWSRLVHAAARAIQGAATTMASAQEDVDDVELMDDEVEEPTRDGSDNQDSLTSWIDDVTEKLRLEAEADESPSGG